MFKLLKTYISVFLIILGGLFAVQTTNPSIVQAAADANVLVTSCTTTNIIFTLDIFASGGGPLENDIFYIVDEQTGSQQYSETTHPASFSFSDTINISLDASSYSEGDVVDVYIGATEVFAGEDPFVDGNYSCTVTGINIDTCNVDEVCTVANPQSSCVGRFVSECRTADNFIGNCCEATDDTVYPTPAPPPPGPHPNEFVECGETNDDYPGNAEFHTLRPYQASVCNKTLSELDLYCGNDLILVHELELTLAEAQALATTPCVDNGTTITCDITLQDEEAEISIDLSDSELPIVGNTQLVPNQINLGNPAPERLSYATRMNEYVSWYLHGAAYNGNEELLNPFETDYDPSATGGIDLELSDVYVDDDGNVFYPFKHIITYAGPLKKLYPQQVTHGLTLRPPNPRSDRIGVTRRGETHNQIYACTAGGNQVPCRFSFASGQYELLQDIEGTPLDPSDDVFTQSVGVRRVLDASAAESPWMVWSSTEDRLGSLFIDTDVVNAVYGTDIQPRIDEGNEASVWDVKLLPTDNGEFVDEELLYFSHMEEAITLTDLLQKTFVPLGVPRSEKAGISEGADTYNTWRCDLKDVRWNSGDDLFGELGNDWLPEPVTDPDRGIAVTGESIKAKVQYDTRFQCIFNFSQTAYDDCYNACLPACDANPPDTVGQPVPPYLYPDCTSYCDNTCKADDTCEVDIMTATQVFTRTPKAEELWDRTVGGTSSVVQKTLPKIGESGMFDELKDYPGITTANYTTSADGYTTYAGEPGAKRPGSQAEIFIPHLGGIKIFFLDTVQDVFRPYEMNSKFLAEGALQPGSGQCATGAGTGGCAVSNLEPIFGDAAAEASGICSVESGGNESSGNVSCLTGGTYDFSVGLFQINLAPVPRYNDDGDLVSLASRCTVYYGFPGAFVEDINDPGVHPNTRNTCKVIDDGTDCSGLLTGWNGAPCNAALKGCIEHVLENNIELAFDISSGGTNFCPWSASGPGYCNNCIN